MLLRPLFLTSFLIDDFLADNHFFGARRVVFSSASSKTAYGTAFMLFCFFCFTGFTRIAIAWPKTGAVLCAGSGQ